MNKTAVLLAGGKGTRLYPYTVALPKPLVPIGDKPIMEILIIRLAKLGFNKIIITVNHQADIIMAYFGDGSKWSVSIEYSMEDRPLGTMGPIKLLKDLPDDFLIMNGDVLTDLDYSAFLDEHIRAGNIFTIASFKRELKSEYGVLEISNNKLIDFREKPITCHDVSMGVYAAQKKILSFIPDNTHYGFDDLMSRMLEEKVSVGVERHFGYWKDIGIPDDYAMACKDLENGIFTY